MQLSTRIAAAMAVGLGVVIGLAAVAGAKDVRIITTGPADFGTPPPDYTMPAVTPIVVMPPPAATGAPDAGAPAIPPPPTMPAQPAVPWPPAAPSPPYGPGVIWIKNVDGPPPGAPVSPDGPALPATAAKKVVMTYLGAAVSPVGDAMAEQLKLPAGTGLLVGDVEDGSPAAKAGIKRFDVLTWLNEQLLVNPPQLHTLVRLQKAGDKVTVKLIRGGKEQTVPVTLAEAERTVGGAVWAGAAGLTTGASGPAIYLDNPMNPVQRAGREQGEASSSRSYADNEHSFAWTSAGGKTNLVVKDTRGKVLFDGPITTDEDMKAVPEPIREKLRKMGNGAPHGGQGQGQGGNGKSLPPVPPPPPIVPHGPVDPPPAVVSPPMHQF